MLPMPATMSCRISSSPTAERDAWTLAKARPGEPPQPVQSQVDPQPKLVREHQDHLLAMGFGRPQHLPVQQRRPVGEPSLRAARFNRLADQPRLERAREPVHRMSFGHSLPFTGPRRDLPAWPDSKV